MSEADEPKQSPEAQSNVTELRSFVTKKEQFEDEYEENPEEYTDAEYADYILAKWAHPSSLGNIFATIARDTVIYEEVENPTATRIAAITSSDHESQQLPFGDVYAFAFEALLDRAPSKVQKEVLDLIHKLQLASLESEQTHKGVRRHMDVIVEKILDEPKAPRPTQKPILRLLNNLEKD